MQTVQKTRIAIIGAGPGGICAGIQLKARGIRDFVILEKADGIGGTWWHNKYPGAECDVQSHLYSFSFELKRDWTRPYAGQAEILSYLEHVVRKYELADFIRMGNAVRSARWDESRALWRLEMADGNAVEAPIVISAMGMFNELSIPAIPGLDTFAGKKFHSARWDHGYDLAGKRVGVIGCAASAVQFLPEIAAKPAMMHVFQRTANWVIPKADTPFTKEQLAELCGNPDALPASRAQIYKDLDAFITFSDKAALADLEKSGLENLSVVKDPELRRKLTPNHPFGCKRPLLSNLYYPIFNRPNVELVTEAIERITPDAIVTQDGVTRPVDTIILATGFQVTRYLSAIEVVGRGGRRIEDAWSEGAQAYLGISTTGFPNLFMLYGPNTNNGSIITMLECQVAYILRQIERLERDRVAWLDVRRDVMQRYNDALQRDIDGVEVWQAACGNYYRGPAGTIVTQWPHTMDEFSDRTRATDRDAYESPTG
jgi:cyclohexanone monooxygenase